MLNEKETFSLSHNLFIQSFFSCYFFIPDFNFSVVFFCNGERFFNNPKNVLNIQCGNNYEYILESKMEIIWTDPTYYKCESILLIFVGEIQMDQSELGHILFSFLIGPFDIFIVGGWQLRKNYWCIFCELPKVNKSSNFFKKELEMAKKYNFVKFRIKI